MAFEAPVPYDHGVENGRLTRPLDFCLLATCPQCLEDGRRRMQGARALNDEAGNRVVAGWSSGSVSIPCTPGGRIVKWGGRAPALPLYKKGRGMAPLNLSSFISFHLGSFLPFAMVRGRTDTSMAATRVSGR